MKKLTLFFLLLTSQFANAQNLLSFSFEGRFVNGVGVPNLIPSNFNDPGISSSTIGRTGLGISPFGGEAMNCNGVSQSTEAVLTSYIEFRVTPVAGKKVNITGIELAMLRSNGTGATKIVLRSNADNFTSNLGGVIDFPNINGNTFLVANQSFNMQDVTSQIIFRVYPFAGVQNFGTWGLGGRSGNDVIVFGTSSDIVLPIDLVKFTAEEFSEKAKISWTTASEFNNEKFILEKSIDGENFEFLTELSGAGTSKELNHYEFVDSKPFAGTSYYKLSQIDFNGRTESFDAIVFHLDTKKLSIQKIMFSNEKANLDLTLFSPIEKLSSLQIIDLNGRKLVDEEIQLLEGYQVVKINLPNINHGMYLIRISNSNGMEFKKLIL